MSELKVDERTGNKWDLYYKDPSKRDTAAPDYIWNSKENAVFARKLNGHRELPTIYGYTHGEEGDYLVIGFDGFMKIYSKDAFEPFYIVSSASELYRAGIRIPMPLLSDLDEYVNGISAEEVEVASNLLWKLSDGKLGDAPGYNDFLNRKLDRTRKVMTEQKERSQ